nr:hypothetical protein CFP56_33115 [Quercus suber]
MKEESGRRRRRVYETTSSLPSLISAPKLNPICLLDLQENGEVCASSSVVEVRSNLEQVILLAKRRSVTARRSCLSGVVFLAVTSSPV